MIFGTGCDRVQGPPGSGIGRLVVLETISDGGQVESAL